MAKKSIAGWIGGITCGLYMTNGIVWLVFGAIWRYSIAGQTAAGDHLVREEDISDANWEKQLEAAQKLSGFQIAGGRFLKIYLSVALWVIILVVLGMAVSSVIMCCCDPKTNTYLQFDKEGEADADAGHDNAQDGQENDKDQMEAGEKSMNE